MKLIIVLSAYGCILQLTFADVSHLQHNNKNRNYLPPELDRDASGQMNHKVKQTVKNGYKHQNEHHHNHEHDYKYNQHDQNAYKHEHKHANDKHVHKDFRQSEPRALTAESNNDIDTYDTSAYSPRDNNYDRARNDNVAEGSELVYAHAPHSLFHTQINVQSQDSDFTTNAGQLPANAGAAAPAFPPNNGGPGGAPDPTTFSNNGGNPGNGDIPGNGAFPGNGPSAPFGVLNIGASNRVETSAQVPFRQQQKENKQGYNVIHGNVADEDLPERSFLRYSTGNTQGVNVIGGNILGRKTNDFARLRTPEHADDAAATNVQHSYTRKSSPESGVEKQSPYVRPYYDNDDFQYEPSAANAPEVIYRQGDDINFNDVQLRENGNDDESHAASETDLRADGYHYKKPSVQFTF